MKYRFRCAFDRFFGHHVVDCQGLSDISQEIEHIHILVEIQVVHHQCFIVSRVEIQELMKLLSLFGKVLIQFLAAFQFPLLILA